MLDLYFAYFGILYFRQIWARSAWSISFLVTDNFWNRFQTFWRFFLVINILPFSSPVMGKNISLVSFHKKKKTFICICTEHAKKIRSWKWNCLVLKKKKCKLKREKERYVFVNIGSKEQITYMLLYLKKKAVIHLK